MIELVAASTPVLAQAVDAVEVVRTLQGLELGRVVRAAVIVAVAWATSRGIALGTRRLSGELARHRLGLMKASSFARLAVLGVATYLTLATLLADQEKAALGVAGALAVAVGFALKDTLSSVMAGVMILIDQPFQVGDRIRFGEVYGEVSEIGLRSVRVRTADGERISVPTHHFLTETVASATGGDLDMQVAIRFHVALTNDVALVKRLVYRACVTSKYVFLNKPVALRVRDEEVGIAFVTTVVCKAYVIDARFEREFVTDVTERVKLAFRRHGVEPPHARLLEVHSAGPADPS